MFCVSSIPLFSTDSDKKQHRFRQVQMRGEKRARYDIPRNSAPRRNKARSAQQGELFRFTTAVIRIWFPQHTLCPFPQFQLRGVNSDTLDIDVGATKSHDVDPDHSTIIGYRFEMIPTEEFAKHRNWDRAHRRDFDVEDGVTYLLVNLIPDTRYLIRVAARNAAGLSDWTEVKEFTTHPLQPHGFNSGAAGPDTGTLLLLRLLTALGSILLSTVVKLKF